MRTHTCEASASSHLSQEPSVSSLTVGKAKNLHVVCLAYNMNTSLSPLTKKEPLSTDKGSFFLLSKPQAWYGINALARCIQLRRSRAWHRAKRVSKLVPLRLDSIHGVAVIPFRLSSDSVPQQVADFIQGSALIYLRKCDIIIQSEVKIL